MMDKNQLRQRVETITENFTETFCDVYFQCTARGITTETFARLCIDKLTEQILQLADELDDERLDDGEEE